MCGIFGVYNLNKGIKIKEHLINDCLKSMAHRGPNNQAYKKINNDLFFAHVRLSIIDLNETGNQPFSDKNDNFSIIYNGEIFNYIEIRSELIALGYKFETSSDTEVLLKSYIHWGEDCVKRFNGMWAFSIYDLNKQKLFCSRDRFGIKPFNYTEIDGQFIYSSEIKAILAYHPELKVPNYNVIANYCRTSIGAQTKDTWFKDIFRLEPAHNLIIDSNGIQLKRYWDYPKSIDKDITFNEAVEKYKKIFIDSVKIRLRSDVPVGITLSSGLDSTSIASVVNQIQSNVNFKTYTAKFDSSNYSIEEKQNYKNDIEINESKIVRKLNSEIEMSSNFIEINYDDYIKKIRKLIRNLESGHGSPAIYPLDQVMERAKKDVTVVLEGQGADELLGGYINIAAMPYIIDLIKRMNFIRAFKEWRILKKTYSYKITIVLFLRQLNNSFINKIFLKFSGIEKLYKGFIKKYKPIKDYPVNPKGFNDELNKHLYKAHTGGLVNLLHYGDAVSMKHSLESRLPFMDYRLVEFAFKLPPEFKINMGQGKYIHRKAMKGILPNFILKNKIKFGFDSPLSEILFKEGKNSVKSILLSDRCLKRNLFDKEALSSMFAKPRNQRINTTRYIYRILCVELWFREFID